MKYTTTKMTIEPFGEIEVTYERNPEEYENGFLVNPESVMLISVKYELKLTRKQIDEITDRLLGNQ
jgi:hypothetical protein